MVSRLVRSLKFFSSKLPFLQTSLAIATLSMMAGSQKINIHEDLIEKFEENERKRLWYRVFEDLQIKSSEEEERLGLTTDVSNQLENQEKNRYCNVIPYDKNRIVLEPDGGYINASPVHSNLTGRKYILTQGPLYKTAQDFWHMVWQSESRIIVMLTSVMERGSQKCYPYFPSDTDVSSYTQKEYGNFVVTLTGEKPTTHYVVREITIQKDGEERTITHYQFISWPDFGVPEDASSFTEFVEAIRDLDDSFSEQKPIICHCSAGIGRSGAYLVVDILLDAMRNGINQTLPMVNDMILEMRRSRMNLVQTPEQLRFCWGAVVNWIRENSPACSTNGETDAANGDVVRECGEEKAPISRKRASTDEEQSAIQKRKEKIENMRRRLREVEDRRGHSKWWQAVPVVVGVAFVSLCVYNYLTANVPTTS